MISKTIKFEDYNGNEREQTYYFHMTEAEVLEWLTTDGDYTIEKVYERMVEKRNGREIIRSVQEMILRSYGERSLDGIEFDKSPEIIRKFKQSPAYSELFMELATDSDKASEFFTGIIPMKMINKIKEDMNNNPEKYSSDERRVFNIGNENNTKVQVLK